MVEVYKRPGSPYWYYDLVDPVTGKRQRKSTKKKLKADAQKVASGVLATAEDRAKVGGEEITVEEACRRYVATVADPKSRKKLEGRFLRLCGLMQTKDAWHLPKGFMLHQVTSGTILTLRGKRVEEGYAPNTINNEVGMLHASWNLARKLGARVHKDLIEWPMPRVRGKLRYLTEEEEDRFLTELDPNRPTYKRTINGKAVEQRMGVPHHVRPRMQDSYDLAVFLLDTGCRYSEIATITWDCIDTITWRWVDIYRTKTDNEDRLTMTPRLREILQRRRKATNGAYVFPGYDGILVDEDKPRGYSAHAIRKALDRAGCNAPHLVQRYGRATCHSLRDTFASRLVQAGMSIYKVSKLLGHASVVQTQKYAHLAPGGVADEAAEILARIHANKSDPSPDERAA
jgi:integrase